MILCVIALSLNTTTTYAQGLVSTENLAVRKGVQNPTNISNRFGITIYFGKAGCNPGFGICRIDIGNQTASPITSDNQLSGVANADAKGNVNIDLVSNATNRAFVEKLKANGALEFDQNVSFKEVIQKAREGGAAMSKMANQNYEVTRGAKYTVGTDAKGRIVITIVVGDVTITITIKW